VRGDLPLRLLLFLATVENALTGGNDFHRPEPPRHRSTDEPGLRAVLFRG